MAVNLNIPSQVKPYANLAAFPATGAVKTIYIAEDTNKTYRWTGSVYVEISATAASTWGGITGTLSNQTDLQNALNTKQDTLVSGTNIKTINGTSVLGSGDISISTGLTVGTTPITSGTIGRVLFQGTGNVLQQSSSLFWDNTNARLGIGTSSPAYVLDVNADNAYFGLNRNPSGSGPALFFFRLAGAGGANVGIAGSANDQLPSTVANDLFLRTNGYSILFGNSSTTWGKFFTNGNLGINTTTDAGFKLDVNGTARVQDRMDVAGTNGRLIFKSPELGTRLNGVHWTNPTDTGSYGYIALSGGSGEMRMFTSGSYFPTFYSSGSERMRIPTTGNVLINTTTDAGFRLDVNGTARFSSDVTVANALMKMYVTGGVIRFEQLGGAGFPIAFMQNGSFYQYIDQATTNISFRNDYSIVMPTGNTSTINSSAKLQIDSTTKGFLPPRMTTTQKNAIATPATGLQVFDTTLNQMSYYNGTTWINL